MMDSCNKGRFDPDCCGSRPGFGVQLPLEYRSPAPKMNYNERFGAPCIVKYPYREHICSHSA